MLKYFRPLGFALGLAIGTAFPAMADILVAPTRIILEDRDRAAELTVVNKGTERQIFRVLVENRRMLEDGSFESAVETRPGELFAKEMVRYAPRRVTLEPGERQTIRIMARRRADLPDGEYRSHLRLMSAPENAGLSAAAASATQGDQLSISLVPIRSITIPVIVRKGALDADVDISQAWLEPGAAGSSLVVRLNRAGNRSSFGHLRIAESGVDLATLRGVAVYVPNDTRTVRIPLTPEQQARMRGRTVDISYTSPDLQAPQVFARSRMTLQ